MIWSMGITTSNRMVRNLSLRFDPLRKVLYINTTPARHMSFELFLPDYGGVEGNCCVYDLKEGSNDLTKLLEGAATEEFRTVFRVMEGSGQTLSSFTLAFSLWHTDEVLAERRKASDAELIPFLRAALERTPNGPIGDDLRTRLAEAEATQA